MARIIPLLPRKAKPLGAEQLAPSLLVPRLRDFVILPVSLGAPSLDSETWEAMKPHGRGTNVAARACTCRVPYLDNHSPRRPRYRSNLNQGAAVPNDRAADLQGKMAFRRATANARDADRNRENCAAGSMVRSFWFMRVSFLRRPRVDAALVGLLADLRVGHRRRCLIQGILPRFRILPPCCR